MPPIGAPDVLSPEHVHRAAPHVISRDRVSGKRVAGSSAIVCRAEELALLAKELALLAKELTQ